MGKNEWSKSNFNISKYCEKSDESEHRISAEIINRTTFREKLMNSS